MATPEPTPTPVPTVIGLDADFTVDSVIATLGTPAERGTEPDGSETLRWGEVSAGGQTWKEVHATFTATGGMVAARRDPAGDVFAEARGLCGPVLAGGGEMVVAWSREVERRFMEPWRTMVESGGAEVGCLYRQPGGFLFAGAGHDVVAGMLIRSSKDDEELKPIVAFFELYKPMNWETEQHFGDRMLVGETAYVVHQVFPSTAVGRRGKRRAAEGAKFVTVLFTMENAGRKTATALAGNLSLLDSQDREFLPSSDATGVVAAEKGIDLMLSQLQPGVPRKQVAVFELPASETELRLLLPGRLGDSGQITVPFSLAKKPSL